MQNVIAFSKTALALFLLSASVLLPEAANCENMVNIKLDLEL